MFIPPEGHILTGEILKAGFDRGYGSNADFRVQIRDVTIRQELGDLVARQRARRRLLRLLIRLSNKGLP
ncbi:hypothetical protein [uncultured Ruegeria sp.]|uniref:hypothetical protein n=1 Tax=uncultured Ruegeria sp. TaxID=259304 RepID=UPI0026038A84|nr:hypothetical protein [uncultured Ruegeria sp.]